MGKLDTYESVEEKSQFFKGDQDYIVGKVAQLFDELETLNNHEYLFRGSKNGTYKLFNSAQREFALREISALKLMNPEYDPYPKWINGMIKEVQQWNSNTLQNYLQHRDGKQPGDFEYLSYMQHNGFPTPLLDFTYNPFVALYFACENVMYNNSDIDLNSCISIYYFNTEHLVYRSMNPDDLSLLSLEQQMPYLEFMEKRPLAILQTDSVLYKIKNSMNIINQRGCFIFNANSTNPLEIEYINLIKNLSSDSPLPNLNVGAKMTCINIHKSVIPKVIELLFKRHNIDQDFIYPNIKKQKDSIINNSIINILE